MNQLIIGTNDSSADDSSKLLDEAETTGRLICAITARSAPYFRPKRPSDNIVPDRIRFAQREHICFKSVRLRNNQTRYHDEQSHGRGWTDDDNRGTGHDMNLPVAEEPVCPGNTPRTDQGL